LFKEQNKGPIVFPVKTHERKVLDTLRIKVKEIKNTKENEIHGSFFLAVKGLNI